MKNKKLPKGISYRADEKRYVGRLTCNGESYVIYGKNPKMLSIKLEELREKVKSKNYVKDTNATLNEWFDRYMELYKKPTIKISTYQNYENHYNYYIRNTIGKKKLAEITVDDIQRVYNELAAKDFSKGMIKLVAATLGGCFKKAYTNRVINYNPIIFAEIPRTKETKDRVALTEDQQRLFLEFAKNSYLNELYCLALMTGLRNGEIRALRWMDIDFEKRVINVNHTLIFVNKEYQLGSPKTRTSKREVPMLNQVFDIIKILYEKAKENGFGNKENYVFCTPDQKPYSRFRVSYGIESIYNEIIKVDKKFPYITCHCLRHTFATRAIEAGMNPQALKNILGHQNLSITMDLYSKVQDKMREAEMDKLNDIFKISYT